MLSVGLFLATSVQAAKDARDMARKVLAKGIMKVRNAPRWLKRTAYGWNIALLFLPLLFYWLPLSIPPSTFFQLG